MALFSRIIIFYYVLYLCDEGQCKNKIRSSTHSEYEKSGRIVVNVFALFAAILSQYETVVTNVSSFTFSIFCDVNCRV